MSLQIGGSAPTFILPGTDGRQHPYGGEDENATVIIFTCNHCPYALAWEERLLQLGRDYRHDGVRFLAINPNDVSIKPADSFEHMKARHEENSWPFPYLRDESQDVAEAYGAKTTPDIFIFNSDNQLAYRGAPDADYEDESLNASWVRDAIDALLAGNTPAVQETEPVGCSVKWKA